MSNKKRVENKYKKIYTNNEIHFFSKEIKAVFATDSFSLLLNCCKFSGD